MLLDQLYLNSIQHLLVHCGSLKQNETLTIICDYTTKELSQAFLNTALKITNSAKLVESPLASRHGQEPCLEAKNLMLSSDLIISLCKFSLAHSEARIEAAKNGARFLSLPLYSWELLADPAVTTNYREQAKIVRTISDAFTNGKKVRVTSKSGTDILLNIEDRIGNYCPGFVEKPGELGSPPDIEANISPIEDQSEGIVVVDGSITCSEIGLVQTNVVLEVFAGKIKKILTANSNYRIFLENIFEDINSKRRVLAECGVGLNPNAKLTGTMLTDEGTLGCIHFGFGSNVTVGGKNKVDFHLDFVFKDCTLSIDNITYIKEGKLQV